MKLEFIINYISGNFFIAPNIEDEEEEGIVQVSPEEIQETVNLDIEAGEDIE